MTVRVRIAPSPTGNLHIGTARTAVFNWLFARNQGGQFILRIEDTDLDRSRPEYTQNILDGLTWLGLTWDEGPFFQSERLELYRDAIKSLLDRGLAYKCYCTPEELEEMRSAQVARKEAPRYDNRHRNLTPEQQADFEAEGRTAVIRFKIDDDLTIRWKDLVREQVIWKGSDLGGDMVIARAATAEEIGQPLYNLAVVVDDMDMNITHVIRGEDHIANTAKQILLYDAFGATIPEFSHTPLILNQTGQKLSKRDGVTSISDFAKMGFTAEGLVNYMTLLGWSAPDSQEIFTLPEAAEKFSFDRVNKAGAKFDWDKLDWINSQYLHQMPGDKLTELLIPYWQEAGYEFDPANDRPWLEQLATLIGPSLTRLQEGVDLSRIFFADADELDEEGQKQLDKPGAIEALEAILEAITSVESWSDDVAKDIIKRVTKAQKVKKGLVMRSLRVGLTGAVHGPDLIQSWGLLHQRGLDRTRLETLLKVDPTQANALGENSSPVQDVDSETPDSEVVEETSIALSETTPEVETSEITSKKNNLEVETSETTSEETNLEVETSETTSEETNLEAETSETTSEETNLEVDTSETTSEETNLEADTSETTSEETNLEVETSETTSEETNLEADISETTSEETNLEADISETTSEVETSLEAAEESVLAETPTPETPEEEAVLAETPTPETPKEEEVVAEIPTPETPNDEAVAASIPVDEGTTTQPEASENQYQNIGETVREVLSNLPHYVSTFFGEWQKPLITIGLIVFTLIGIKVLVAVLNVFNGIPLIAPTLELIGLAYSLWFVYRYLLKSSTRAELSELTSSFVEQIAGQNSSNS